MAAREVKQIIISGGTDEQKKLFEDLGIKCELVEFAGMPDLDGKELENEMIIQEIAHFRGKEVAKKMFDRTHHNFIVIATETAAIFGNRILKVPKTKLQAERLLKKLSGKTHKIVTGLCVWWGGKGVTVKDETFVTLRKITDDEIKEYVETENFSYPGGYSIQGVGAGLVESIEGTYHNLLGIPVNKVYEALEEEFLFRLLKETDCGVWMNESSDGGEI